MVGRCRGIRFGFDEFQVEGSSCTSGLRFVGAWSCLCKCPKPRRSRLLRCSCTLKQIVAQNPMQRFCTVCDHYHFIRSQATASYYLGVHTTQHLQPFKEVSPPVPYTLHKALCPSHRTRQDADKRKPWRERRQMPTDARSPREEG